MSQVYRNVENDSSVSVPYNNYMRSFNVNHQQPLPISSHNYDYNNNNTNTNNNNNFNETFNKFDDSFTMFTEEDDEEINLIKALEVQVNDQNPALFLENLEKIADGTTSTVYRANEIKTKNLVAIKSMKLKEQRNKHLVYNELMIMKMINHSSIVQYLDSFLINNSFGPELWLVMEYLDGGTLADVVTKTRLMEQQIAKICEYLLKALSYLHGIGIMHRDIKSDCVLLNSDGQVKLSDFGLSIKLTPETPRRRSLVGTPYWMAPEVISKEPYDTSADIWSFGILVYEMIDGEPPYFNDIPPHAMRKIKEDPPARIKNFLRVSPMLQGFVEKMIVKDPNNRLTADELLGHPFLKKATSPDCLLSLINY